MPDVRKPKAPVSAWIVEHRKRLGWKSEELAQKLDVSDSTVRGWESGRSVSADNLAAMERLFGREAPGTKEPGGVDATGLFDAMTAALLATAQAVTDVRLELADARREAEEQRLASAELIGTLARELRSLRALVETQGVSVAPRSGGREG